MNPNTTKPHFHSGSIRIGQYSIFGGSAIDVLRSGLEKIDIIVSLSDRVPYEIWHQDYSGAIWSYPIKDFNGPNGPWLVFLNKVIAEMRNGKKVFVFCAGGHGRTGMFLASLIALMEVDERDPILAVRSRYCPSAVESIEQARAIFSLKKEKVPEIYKELPRAEDLTLVLRSLILKSRSFVK